MKNKLILLSVFLFSAFFLSSSGAVTVTQWEDEVYLVQGEIASVGVVSPRRVSIADPAVADIDSVNSKELVLVGKGPGNTVLTIWDKLGQRTLNVKVVTENLDYLKARIDQLLIDNLGLKEVLTRVNGAEGKIVILGRANPEQQENIGLLLAPFSDKIINLIKIKEDALVQIDVQILELSKDDADNLGVDWMKAINFTEEPIRGSTTAASGGTVTTLNRIGGLSEMVRISSWSRDAITGAINLLVSRGKGRVLSRPKLVCLSGKEAEFLVGGQLPIITSNATSTAVTSNIDYRDYGIKLKIKPTVGTDNQINTQMHVEVSEIDTARGVATTTTNAPAFSNRSIDSELSLRDGQTLFIAGLIKNKDTSTINKFPGLADVPIIGVLFRSKNFIKGDTELIVSITPTIIRQAPPAISAREEKAVLPAISAAEPQDPILKYVNEVQKIIAGSIHYPSEAKDAGWEGKVNLKLHLKSDGSLSEVGLSKSSGYEIFDETADSVVKSLSPYPPFPADIAANDLWIEVPVVFQRN